MNPGFSLKMVFFDMDGLMVDTEPIHSEAYNRVLGKFGVSLTPEENNGYIGVSDKIMTLELVEKYGIPISADELYREKSAVYRGLLKGNIEAKPGLYSLIDYLKASEIPMSVVSTSPLGEIRAIVEYLALKSCFSHLVSGDHVKNGKPYPDIYLLAARCCGLQPPECLAFEDSIPGVESAARAGVMCFAVPGPGFSPADFHRAGAVFSSLGDITRYLSAGGFPRNEESLSPGGEWRSPKGGAG